MLKKIPPPLLSREFGKIQIGQETGHRTKLYWHFLTVKIVLWKLCPQPKNDQKYILTTQRISCAFNCVHNRWRRCLFCFVVVESAMRTEPRYQTVVIKNDQTLSKNDKNRYILNTTQRVFCPILSASLLLTTLFVLLLLKVQNAPQNQTIFLVFSILICLKIFAKKHLQFNGKIVFFW